MDKQKMYGTIIGIMAFIALIVGITLAYWSWASTVEQKTMITFTVASGFTCSADGGGDITSNDVSLAPAACTNSMYAIQREVKVNTTQDAGTTIYLDMWLHVNSISANLTGTSNFKYALTTSSEGCTAGTVVSSGNFSGVAQNDDIKILSSKEYQSTTSNDTYYLYIWLDSTETDNATQNGTFSFSLGGSCTNQEPPKLSDIIASSVLSTPTVNFAQTSVANGTNGLYLLESTANDTHPVYYYRGDVTNNNVLFAGFCWKIVRTTSTGGTKLIYNGTSADGKCNNTTGTVTQLSSTSYFNSNYSLSAYVGYMHDGDTYTYTRGGGAGTGWKYAPDVTYDNGVYTLIDKGSYVVETKSDISGTNLSYHHYTCGNATDITCETVKYVYYVNSGTAWYINLTNNKRPSDALYDMLTNTGNTQSSTIKSAIDNWYLANMTSYTNMLEDTIWCNDRSIYQLNGWDPDGGSTASSLYFGPYGRMASTHAPIVTCPSKNDSFTVTESSTGNGKLTYPVGLLTADEINMAGGLSGITNNSYYLYNNQVYWTLSPFSLDIGANEWVGTGRLGNFYVINALGVRPSVSLKPGIVLSGGNGTGNNPYTVR